MAAKDQRGPGKPPLPNMDPAEFADMTRKQVDTMVGMQKEFMKNFEEANQVWAARMQAETALATEFAGKLSAARSLPETTSILQEWMTRRMALLAEDSQRFATDMQKVMSATTRLMPPGWPGWGGGGR
jgi:hypothetical protein